MDAISRSSDARRQLEHRAGSASARDYRLSRVSECRSPDPARGGLQRAPHTAPQYCRGDRTPTGNELRLRTRIRGIDTGFANLPCLPWPGDAVAMASGEPACDPVPPSIELLASPMVSAAHGAVSGAARRAHCACNGNRRRRKASYGLQPALRESRESRYSPCTNGRGPAGCQEAGAPVADVNRWRSKLRRFVDQSNSILWLSERARDPISTHDTGAWVIPAPTHNRLGVRIRSCGSDSR